MQRSYEKLSSEVLDAASAPVRLHVLKLLASKGSLPYTEIMYESKLDPVRDAGKFVYHLKTLRKAGLVGVEKGTKKYMITELGKVLVEFSRDLEEYLAVKRGRLYVRTSQMTIQEFDRTRIADSLVKEAGMPQSLASDIATEAEDRLLRIGTSYLTAPLIRELVNTILVERKLDEYRHKLTRLGLPVNDVSNLLKEASEKHLDPAWVERSAGIAVAEEYTLLNGLPRDLVDAHLSGEIHLDHPDSWILKPSKLYHDTGTVFKNGLPGASPPESLTAAIATVSKLVRIGDGQVSSDQVFNHLNIYLAPFLKSDQEHGREAVRLFLDSLNWDGFSNNIPPRFTIGLDNTVPDQIGALTAIGPGGKTDGKYRDYKEEANRIFRLVLEGMLENGKRSILLNPNIVIRLRGSIEDHGLDLAYRNSLSNGIPNYLVSENSNPRHGIVLGTVLVNLPRAAYDAGGRDERLLQTVIQETRHAVEALELRYHAVHKRLAEGLLPLLSWRPNGTGAYYDEHETHAHIGLIGLDEAIKFHVDAPLEEKESIGLVRKIVESSKKIAQEVDNTPDLKIHVGLHGSAEASSRFAEVDSEKYGFSTILYQGSKRLPYYTDLPALPLTRKIPLEKRVAIEGEIQRLIEGEGIVTLPIGAKTTPDALSRLSKNIIETGSRNFAYTKIVSSCLNCHSTEPKIRSRCENCGSDRLTIVGRCSGRTLPLDLWPPARVRDLGRVVEYDQ